MVQGVGSDELFAAPAGKRPGPIGAGQIPYFAVMPTTRVDLWLGPHSKEGYQPIPVDKYSPSAERESSSDDDSVMQGIPGIVFARKNYGAPVCRQQG